MKLFTLLLALSSANAFASESPAVGEGSVAIPIHNCYREGDRWNEQCRENETMMVYCVHNPHGINSAPLQCKLIYNSLYWDYERKQIRSREAAPKALISEIAADGSFELNTKEDNYCYDKRPDFHWCNVDFVHLSGRLKAKSIEINKAEAGTYTEYQNERPSEYFDSARTKETGELDLKPFLLSAEFVSGGYKTADECWKNASAHYDYLKAKGERWCAFKGLKVERFQGAGCQKPGPNYMYSYFANVRCESPAPHRQ